MEELERPGETSAKLLFLASFVVFVSFPFATRSDDAFDPTIFMKGHALISPQAQIAAAGISSRYHNTRNREITPANSHYFMNFETGAEGWQASGSWQVGSLPLALNKTANNGQIVATNLAGSYRNQADSVLVSPAINLPDTAPDTELLLSFDELYQLESYHDLGTIDISTDGAKTWTRLISSRSGSTHSQWINSSYLLNDYAGQTINLRFRLKTDSSHRFAGWHLDNIAVFLRQKPPTRAHIRRVNTSHFPLIYAELELTPQQEICTNLLDSTEFRIAESGIEQTILNVEAPSDSDTWGRLDVVFVYDNSGSMRLRHKQIEAKIEQFIDYLVATNVDLAVGLSRYGNHSQTDSVKLENAGNLTTDTDYFISAVLPESLTNESYEPSYHAIGASTQSFSFRPGSKRLIFLISNEFAAQGESTVAMAHAALQEHNIDFFALIPSTYFGDYEALTRNPGNQLINIDDDLLTVAKRIKNSLGNTYRLGYRASDSGMAERQLSISVRCRDTLLQASTEYTPGDFPVIRLSPGTRNKHKSAQPGDSPLRIVALVADSVAPFVNTANLVFRAGQDRYQSLVMEQISPTKFIADIPPEAIQGPKVQYYITATDGNHIASLPSRAPANHPFELTIAPYSAPSIELLPSADESVAAAFIAAQVTTKSDNKVDSVTLFHRYEGELTYSRSLMLAINPQEYATELPANHSGGKNIEFFIEAKSERGFISRWGNPDEPQVHPQ